MDAVELGGLHRLGAGVDGPGQQLRPRPAGADPAPELFGVEDQNPAMQIAHQRQYNWDITVVQPLFTGFALRSQYDIARLDTVAKELEKAQAVLDVTRHVRGACYRLLLAQQLLKVSDSEVETLAAHKRDAELFYGQGLIPPNDQLKAEVALSNSLQENGRVRAEVKKAKIRINRLLNRPLDTELVIEDKTLSII